MSCTQWSKHDPIRNCFLMPIEVYHLGLSCGAIVVYGYLLHIENRKTYQCYAGYKTIGNATGMSANTVRKYVMELKSRGLIRTERTTIVTKDGRTRNGVLRYHIRPIQEAVDRYSEWQMQRMACAAEEQNAQTEPSRHSTPQTPLSETGQHPSTPVPQSAAQGFCGERAEDAGSPSLPVNRGVEKSAG